MPRYIDADALKRKAQKTATEAWKMKLMAKIETTLNQFIDWIDEQPTYTEAEIQKMQDLEQAQIEKAYQLGYEEGKKDAQPEYRLDEWCHDCKEYDQEHHCCPRFNRVIRESLKEARTERKKDLIQRFHDYQTEWLKNHYDIELEPQLEELIVRFLHDTANMFTLEMLKEGREE